MIKFAGILLTLCATSLVVINIRTLETVETSPDDRPALIETCLVARWAGYPAAFSSSWDLSGRYKKEQEIALGVARRFSRYNLSATFYLAVDELHDSLLPPPPAPRELVRALAGHEIGLGSPKDSGSLAWTFREGEEWRAENFPGHGVCRSLVWNYRGFSEQKAVAAEVFESALDPHWRRGYVSWPVPDEFDWYALRSAGTIETVRKWWNGNLHIAHRAWAISFDGDPGDGLEPFAKDVAAQVARGELWVAPVGSVVAYVRGAAELSVAHAFVGADALVIRADGAPGVPWAVRLSCASTACRGFWDRHASYQMWDRHARRLVSDGATLFSDSGRGTLDLLIRGLAAGHVYVFGAAVDATLAGITSQACEVEPAYYGDLD